MRRSSFLVIAGIFIVASGLMYLIHYMIFRDAHYIFLYLIGDLALLPLEAFLVVVVIERILNHPCLTDTPIPRPSIPDSYLKHAVDEVYLRPVIRVH